MAQAPIILVVDDDASIVDLIKDVLSAQGYDVRHAPSLFRAAGLLARTSPDVIILDRQLPDGDGMGLLAKLKKEEATAGIPVLFVSAAQKSAEERARGIEQGADDYLAKPFNPSELTARVRALLRRAKALPPRKTILEAGPLVMNLDSCKVALDKKELDLTPKEFQLLATFLGRPNWVFSRQALIQLVWGPGKELDRNSKVVDVAIGGLKKKLGVFGEKIVNVRGVGFRLDLE